MAAVVMSNDGGIGPAAGVTGSLATTGDWVELPVNGSALGSVKISTSGTFSQVLTPEILIGPDGDVNWLPAPYVKRIDAAGANPAVSPTITANAGTYDLVIPSNARKVRVKTTVTSGTAVVGIAPARWLTADAPVYATLYDVAVAAGAANNTGTLDVSGWTGIEWTIVVTTATTGAVSFNKVDDAGTAIALGSAASLTAGTYVGAMGPGRTPGTGFTWLTGLSQLDLARRISFALAGATTSAIRLIVGAKRGL